MKTYIYHNPRWSKSRESVKILNKNNVDYKIVNYIKEGVSKTDLLTICKFLDIKPINIIRTSDQYYKDLEISSEDMNKDEFLLDVIIKNPTVLQRPIFINGNKAIIGRPPERVLDIL